MSSSCKPKLKAKAYLKQNIDLKLCQIFEKDALKIIQFKVEFSPFANNVVAYSRRTQDTKLANELKCLLQNNDSGNAGQIEITVSLYPPKIHGHLRRPQDGNQEQNILHITVLGNFPPFLEQLYPWKSSSDHGGFILNFKNMFAGKQYPGVNPDFHFTRLHDTEKYLIHPLPFYLNAETWDLWFGTGTSLPERNVPQLTVGFGIMADSSEWTTPLLPIIYPTGKGYCLNPALNNIVTSRCQDIESGEQPDVVIVGDSGSEWRVFQKYLVDGSEVFQAMLDTKGFMEEKTKRISLPEISDEVIAEMLKYLYFFDMSTIVQDIGMAIEMLEVAERYQINKLKDLIQSMLLKRPNEDFSTGQILKLFTLTRNLMHFTDLSVKVLKVLKSKCADLGELKDVSDLFHKEPEIAQDLLQLALLNMKDN